MTVSSLIVLLVAPATPRMIVLSAHGSHHEQHGERAGEDEKKRQNAAQANAEQWEKEYAHQHHSASRHHQQAMLSHFHKRSSS
jgi:hypothetical protein